MIGTLRDLDGIVTFEQDMSIKEMGDFLWVYVRQHIGCIIYMRALGTWLPLDTMKFLNNQDELNRSDKVRVRIVNETQIFISEWNRR